MVIKNSKRIIRLSKVLWKQCQENHISTQLLLKITSAKKPSKKLGQLAEKPSKKDDLSAAFCKKHYSKPKTLVIHWSKRMDKKLLARKENQFTWQIYSFGFRSKR